jgi:hypothetical protein
LKSWRSPLLGRVFTKPQISFTAPRFQTIFREFTQVTSEIAF